MIFNTKKLLNVLKRLNNNRYKEKNHTLNLISIKFLKNNTLEFFATDGNSFNIDRIEYTTLENEIIFNNEQKYQINIDVLLEYLKKNKNSIVKIEIDTKKASLNIDDNFDVVFINTSYPIYEKLIPNYDVEKKLEKHILTTNDIIKIGLNKKFLIDCIKDIETNKDNVIYFEIDLKNTNLPIKISAYKNTDIDNMVGLMPMILQ